MAADLSTLSASEQAGALADGTTSSRALLEACLGRIDTHDAAIGAIWHLDTAGARTAADQSDKRRRDGRVLGRFDGIGITVKDNINVSGLVASAGLAAFRGRIAAHDAPVVSRLKAAGLVIIGKTALHEGALGATTDTPGFGRCTNPLKAGFTPGGSSGGSAAAVAAGYAPLAVGTDTMGSVRIPAAYCGITGIKPSAGLVSRSGIFSLSATLDSVGMLAKTPRDAAFGLELLVGFDATDPQSRRARQGWSALPPTQLEMKRQTIALPRQLDQMDIEPAIMASHEQACRTLAACGAKLVETDIAHWEPAKLRRAALLLAEAEASLAHADLIDDPAAASSDYRAALDFGRRASSGRLIAALAELAWVRADVERVLESADAIFLPTAPQRAFAHGSPVPSSQADLTVLANVCGLPAIAIPWPAPDAGLPASMQLIGRAFDEARIVGIADAMLARR